MEMDEKILLQSNFWERMRFKQKKNPGNFKILSVSKTKATLHTIFLRLRQLFTLFLLCPAYS